MIYLDTSALAKLIRHEQASTALAEWLDEHTKTRWITSTLTEVELPRAIIRVGQPDGLAAIPAVLARLDRFEIDEVVRRTAAAYQQPALRSLDAIHLATASVAASIVPLTAFVTYDIRQADAASTLGIATVSPA